MEGLRKLPCPLKKSKTRLSYPNSVRVWYIYLHKNQPHVGRSKYTISGRYGYWNGSFLGGLLWISRLCKHILGKLTYSWLETPPFGQMYVAKRSISIAILVSQTSSFWILRLLQHTFRAHLYQIFTNRSNKGIPFILSKNLLNSCFRYVFSRSSHTSNPKVFGSLGIVVPCRKELVAALEAEKAWWEEFWLLIFPAFFFGLKINSGETQAKTRFLYRLLQKKSGWNLKKKLFNLQTSL